MFYIFSSTCILDDSFPVEPKTKVIYIAFGIFMTLHIEGNIFKLLFYRLHVGRHLSRKQSGRFYFPKLSRIPSTIGSNSWNTIGREAVMETTTGLPFIFSLVSKILYRSVILEALAVFPL